MSVVDGIAYVLHVFRVQHGGEGDVGPYDECQQSVHHNVRIPPDGTGEVRVDWSGQPKNIDNRHLGMSQ